MQVRAIYKRIMFQIGIAGTWRNLDLEGLQCRIIDQIHVDTRIDEYRGKLRPIASHPNNNAHFRLWGF